MERIIAVGGCHITSGKRKLFEKNHNISIDKRIPYQLSQATDKSLNILQKYIKTHPDVEISLILQTGNLGFSNSSGNFLGFGKARNIFKTINSNVTDEEFNEKSSVNARSKKSVWTFFKYLIYLSILPLNFVVVSLKYIPKVIQLKKLINQYENITKVYVLTPFSSFCNFHWILRRYGSFVFKLILNDKVFCIIDTYKMTNRRIYFQDDCLHLNDRGFQLVEKAVENAMNTSNNLNPTKLCDDHLNNSCLPDSFAV